MAPNVGLDVALAGRRANVRSKNAATMFVRITVGPMLEIASGAAALQRCGSFTSLMLHGIWRMLPRGRVSMLTSDECFTVARTPVTTDARVWRWREKGTV